MTDWKKVPIPPLHEFKPQQPKRIELPNGMVIFLQEDHELPLVTGTAVIRGGSRDEPPAKVSLTSIYGEAWRTGGTTTRTGDDLDDYLEARAAKVESMADDDSTALLWTCLKGDLDDVFKVFMEVLRAPEFRQEKIDLAKDQSRTEIARRNDNPMGIASREARKLVYGADSPYARTPEYATVAAVTRQDLLAWHQRTVHPNNIILGVSGDFDPQVMESKLREAFASWPKGPAVEKLETQFPGPKPGVYLVEKDDVNQSNIRMVHLGTTRDNPDYYAIEVLNELFGGSFSSRLFSNVRTGKGLAYAVWGRVGTAYDHPGIFQMGVSTKSNTTAAAIDALFEEIDGLAMKPPTEEELKKAKDAILNSFIFRFDSKGKVLRERMTYEFHHYPADFLERYRAGIEKVTQAEVVSAAKKYIHKDKLAILVVGNAKDFDRPLTSFGAVTPVDISIPEPPGAKMAGPATSNPEGRALIAKIIQSLGGTERIKAIKSLKQKVSISLNTPQGEMVLTGDQITVFPDRAWQKMASPMGEMTIVVSPSGGRIKGPMGSRDMPASRKDETLADLKRDPLSVVQHAGDPTYIFAAAGAEKVGDVEARILEVNADSASVRWYVDGQSGRILRAASPAGGPEPGERVTDYSDWKTIGGVTLPFRKVRTRGGEKESSIEIKEIEFNPAVDPKLFEKPEGNANASPQQ
ncbi:MAG: insulinase family protein [Acidobacteria bacterium]|nr:insulinase family protein [Acidobacteriota bacterium]